MLLLRHILLLSSGYLHYISITSSFISWYNNVISGSRKTKQHISLELPQQTDVMWRHKTLIWSLAPVWGQSRADWDWPLSVRLWEESICSDGELRERETHRPETLCHTDDAGDHFWQPPGAGARDHGFFNSAFTLRYLLHTPDISWLAACVISLYVCHTESKSLLSITAALLSISRIYRSSGCSFKFMTWRQETFGQVKN